MADYKVRNSRNDDGTYTMSYGRGAKKLECLVIQHDDALDASAAHEPRPH